MANPYDAYLNRTVAQSQKDPYLAYAKQRMASMAKPLQQIRETAQQSSYRSGMSSASQSQLYSSLQQQEIGAREQISLEHDTQLGQYRAKMEDKVNEIQFQKDQYDEQKRIAEKQRKKNMIGGIAQVGGTLLGAGVGALAGNPMIGATIGASLGTGASGFITNNPDQIVQGGVTLATGIADAMTVGAKKDAMKGLGGIIGQLDEQGLAKAQFLLESGDYEALKEFTSGYRIESQPFPNTMNLDFYNTRG